MGAKKEMRPIIFKGGRDFGKVEGIRGLYKDPSGRWFVRKAIDGIDKQKRVDFGGKNPTFSLADRLAYRAVRELEQEIAPIAESKQPTANPEQPKQPTTVIGKGQQACFDFIQNQYSKGVSKDILRRRLSECKGFAFVTKELSAHETEINDHNVKLLADGIQERIDAGKLVAALDFHKHIGAVFSKAIEYGGKHMGCNPSKRVARPADMAEKDNRWISMQDSARVQARLPLWAKEQGVSKDKLEQVCLFHYLITLGMRPSSAMAFHSDDLKAESDGSFRYRVINTKTKRKMPNSQLIPHMWGKALKKLGAFSLCEKSLLDATNKAIRDILGNEELTAKHLRKGFITEVINSGEFSYNDARRLTHKTSDIVENHYFGLSQQSADAVSEWWNLRWNDAFEMELSKAKFEGHKLSAYAQYSLEEMKKQTGETN